MSHVEVRESIITSLKCAPTRTYRTHIAYHDGDPGTNLDVQLDYRQIASQLSMTCLILFQYTTYTHAHVYVCVFARVPPHDHACTRTYTQQHTLHTYASTRNMYKDRHVHVTRSHNPPMLSNRNSPLRNIDNLGSFWRLCGMSHASIPPPTSNRAFGQHYSR